MVEHDLAVLDYLSDFICCLYGKPGAYGVVTLPFSVREGINIFLAGFVPTENLRFREEALTFKARGRARLKGGRGGLKPYNPNPKTLTLNNPYLTQPLPGRGRGAARPGCLPFTPASCCPGGDVLKDAGGACARDGGSARTPHADTVLQGLGGLRGAAHTAPSAPLPPLAGGRAALRAPRRCRWRRWPTIGLGWGSGRAEGAGQRRWRRWPTRARAT